jgi:hypothetical protein
MDVSWDIKTGVQILIKIPITELINLSLAHVYCSMTLSNHGLIRLKNSSRKIHTICVISYFLVYI